MQQFLIVLLALMSTSAAAKAQTLTKIPASPHTVAGHPFVFDQHKIEGTLFGKQLWIRVNDTASARKLDHECNDGKCWIFIGKYKAN